MLMGRPAEVLECAREMLRLSDERRTRQRAAYRSAMAFAALDSLEAASSALDKAIELKIANQGMNVYLTLRAEIEIARGRPLDALQTLEEAASYGMYNVGGIDNIRWREAKAEAYWASGQLEKAMETHLEMISAYESHALSHYELGKLYEEMKRPADARREYEIFLDMWKDADEGLPQPEDARNRLASLTSS
jgi:tetratricopeptide (TPR) repeat protein